MSCRARKSSLRPISLFIPALNGGGAQRVVVALANEFVDLVERPVHVVLVSPSGCFTKDLRSEVSVINLGARRTLFSLFHLASYLHKIKPVAVMSTLNYANIVCIIAHFLACRPGRLVVREASVFLTDRIAGKLSFRQKWINCLTRLFYPLAEVVIANSPDTQRSLMEAQVAKPHKIKMIPNPVQTDWAEPTPEVLHEYALKLPPNKYFLCAIGRLVPTKGFDHLLEAFAKIQDKNLCLVIMGEGPERESLKHLAESLGLGGRVFWPGFVQRPDVVLRASQGFVLSSRWEGFGNVLVEALASGVPIVSVNCPGGPDFILQGGEFGQLVPLGDTDALAQEMERVLSDPVSSSEQRRARSQCFSPPKIAEEYMKCLLD